VSRPGAEQAPDNSPAPASKAGETLSTTAFKLDPFGRGAGPGYFAKIEIAEAIDEEFAGLMIACGGGALGRRRSMRSGAAGRP